MTKFAEEPQNPVSVHPSRQLRSNPKATAPGSKPQKRENTFSQSRDTREDRGARQMKTSHNPQTFPHGGNH